MIWKRYHWSIVVKLGMLSWILIGCSGPSSDPINVQKGDVQYGETTQIETLTKDNEQHLFEFQGHQGDVVEILVTPIDPIELNVRVFPKNDTKSITEMASDGRGQPVNVRIVLPLTGNYIVAIGPWWVRYTAGNKYTGDYTLTIENYP